ncbi:hypothetical protein, partial [Bacillus thuringiensis]|uniref:hypothetical protein n=2 Tax=Bacillus TaxID=1386 RepID=UPI001145CA13
MAKMIKTQSFLYISTKRIAFFNYMITYYPLLAGASPVFPSLLGDGSVPWSSSLFGGVVFPWSLPLFGGVV